MLLKREAGTIDPCHCRIPLRGGKSAIIDFEDYQEISRYKWFLVKSSHCFYAARKCYQSEKCNLVRMHRQIMKTPVGFHVHHKNHNCLDNRRRNLETLTPEEHYYVDFLRD